MRIAYVVGITLFTVFLGSLMSGCTVTASAELRNPIQPRVAQAEPAPETPISDQHAAQTATISESEARPDLGPAGVPDGLTFFGDRPDREQVPFETRMVTNLLQHSFTTEGVDFDPDVYAAEQRIVFSSTRNSEHPDIYLKSVDGVTLTQLTGDPADDIQPRFSPDGTKVVFCSNRSGNWDIWVVDRDGTNLTQLTSGEVDEVSPCWSPDGERIAYTVWGGRSHQWEIWTLSTAQPGTRRFLINGMFPAWSPNGEQIAFQRARQRGSHLFSVWTITLESGEARHPTEVAHSDVAACIAPRWAPKGDMLVYCAVQEGQRSETGDSSTPPAADLWAVELEKGTRLKLTDGSAAYFNPVWASGGRIFFVSSRAGTENIWSLTTTMGEYARSDEPDPRMTSATVNGSVSVTKD